jgi:predicted RNA-binding Zn ribbon-like protein
VNSFVEVITVAGSLSQTHSLAPDLPFQYIGGDPAVDLVNTVDWTSRGPEEDRLSDYGRLTRWAEGAGILSARVASSLRAQAQAKPREAEAAYRAALQSRAILARLFRAIASKEPAGDVLENFNPVLGRALERMQVTPARPKRPSGQTLELGWPNQQESLDSVLWPVIWSAASLIVSEEASRIRICSGQDCGWMYVDRSRNKLRRWCQMETCGTREKSRRRYRRLRSNG